VWRYDGMAAWRYGGVGVWGCGGMAAQVTRSPATVPALGKRLARVFVAGRSPSRPLDRVLGSTPPAIPCLRLRDNLPSRLLSIRREVALLGVLDGLGFLRSGGNPLVALTLALSTRCLGGHGPRESSTRLRWLLDTEESYRDRQHLLPQRASGVIPRPSASGCPVDWLLLLSQSGAASAGRTSPDRPPGQCWGNGGVRLCVEARAMAGREVRGARREGSCTGQAVAWDWSERE
jgi:hypothetical protein